MGQRASPLCEECGVEDTEQHLLLECARGDAVRTQLIGPGGSATDLLSDPKTLLNYLRTVGRI